MSEKCKPDDIIIEEYGQWFHQYILEIWSIWWDTGKEQRSILNYVWERMNAQSLSTSEKWLKENIKNQPTFYLGD